ncbi:MAG: 50S ribosomal protein L4 [Rhodospirillales bacterium]|nr:50S ribosomal protein L4 [Alphaproteobacteria bacterium]USO04301.1 MAG: 50S ribosomal protein L4 [Rhodospirillales bacterium]
MKVAVKTLENKAAGEITLDDEVFGADVRQDLLHQMVNYQLSRRQAGTHKTKERSEVAGTGKKPFKQKGTGSARRGDNKRNIDRGGGVVHGPRVRSHAIAMSKNVRKLAMKTALSSKAKDGKLIVIDEAKAKDHKTKPMAAMLGKFGFGSAVIVGGKEIDPNFARATANLPGIDVLPSQGANVYDILRRDTLVLTKEAVSDLTEKLKG